MASQHIGLYYMLYDLGSREYIRFNYPELDNNIGFITELTGLDSPEVRESAEDLVQSDGGIHGTFLHGRRSISITGVIAAPTSSLDRQNKANLLSKITNLLRYNGELIWTDVDGITKYVTVRLQSPVRVSGGWNKTFHFTLVADDPNIYSFTQTTQTITGGSGTITNQGTTPTYVTLRLYGGHTNPSVSHVTRGETLALSGLTTGGVNPLIFDTKLRTVYEGTLNRYTYLTATGKQWFMLAPGGNQLSYQSIGVTGSPRMEVVHRDAWI